MSCRGRRSGRTRAGRGRTSPWPRRIDRSWCAASAGRAVSTGSQPWREVWWAIRMTQGFQSMRAYSIYILVPSRYRCSHDSAPHNVRCHVLRAGPIPRAADSDVPATQCRLLRFPYIYTLIPLNSTVAEKHAAVRSLLVAFLQAAADQRLTCGLSMHLQHHTVDTTPPLRLTPPTSQPRCFPSPLYRDKL